MDNGHEDDNENERFYPGEGEQYEIGPQNTGHRAARSDHRNDGLGVRGDVAKCGNGPAHQIKQNEPEFPQHVFNIVAEYPEIEHIPGQMPKAGMQEHGGIDGGIF